MLNHYFSTLFTFLPNYVFLVTTFIVILSKTQYSFYKVWLVFIFLITQSMLLGFFGEDFYIFLIFAAEIPVFFSFFFFCVTKTKLNVNTGKKTKMQRNTTPTLFCVLITLYLVFPKTSYISMFAYYTPSILTHVTQRSDFFLFYFSFFLLSPSIVIFIGLLISVVTLILLFFTFKTQIISASAIIKNKNIAWVRMQDIATQSTQKRAFVFFKI